LKQALPALDYNVTISLLIDRYFLQQGRSKKNTPDSSKQLHLCRKKSGSIPGSMDFILHHNALFGK